MEDTYRILVDNPDEVFELENSDIFNLLNHENGIAYRKLKSFPLISKERLEHLENCERIAMGVSKEANLEPGQFFTIGKKGEA